MTLRASRSSFTVVALLAALRVFRQDLSAHHTPRCASTQIDGSAGNVSRLGFTVCP